MYAKSKCQGLTLVELLVVLAVIVILLALLMPALRGALESARNNYCQTNMQTIGIASLSFADDHYGYMPGVYYGIKPWQYCWLGNEVGSDHVASAYEGTLVPYVGGREAAKTLYRCPSLPFMERRTGVGSNGMFDYSALMCFGGARIAKIPSLAKVQIPVLNTWYQGVPVPFIVEVDPAFYVNNSKGLPITPYYNGTARMGTWHGTPTGVRNGNYVAVDGSVKGLSLIRDNGPTPGLWTVTLPNRTTTTTLFGSSMGFGAWNPL